MSLQERHSDTSSLVPERTDERVRSRADLTASGADALWVYFDELGRNAILIISLKLINQRLFS
jgi:hypothetical protein